MNYFKHYFLDIMRTKYTKLRGRATRKEFWNFLFLAILFSLLVLVVGESLKRYILMPPDLYTFITAMQILLWLSLLLPLFAIGSRRLHDIGKSRWWYLLLAIPGIGIAILLILFLMPSEQRINRYGKVRQEHHHSIYNILKNA